MWNNTISHLCNFFLAETLLSCKLWNRRGCFPFSCAPGKRWKNKRMISQQRQDSCQSDSIRVIFSLFFFPFFMFWGGVFSTIACARLRIDSSEVHAEAHCLSLGIICSAPSLITGWTSEGQHCDVMGVCLVGYELQILHAKSMFSTPKKIHYLSLTWPGVIPYYSVTSPPLGFGNFLTLIPPPS